MNVLSNVEAPRVGNEISCVMPKSSIRGVQLRLLKSPMIIMIVRGTNVFNSVTIIFDDLVLVW